MTITLLLLETTADIASS